jgi:hypothetical protein
MNRLLLYLTIFFGILFIAGLTWFIVEARSRSRTDPAPGPASLFDRDEDGLTDAEETEFGTNPSEADSDFDGLDDKSELEIYATDPLNEDSDGDTYIDGVEVLGGYNPKGP